MRIKDRQVKRAMRKGSFSLKSTEELRRRWGREKLKIKKELNADMLREREKKIREEIKFKGNVNPKIFVERTLIGITKQMVLNAEIASLLRTYKKELSEGKITGELKKEKMNNATHLGMEAGAAGESLLFAAITALNLSEMEVAKYTGTAAAVTAGLAGIQESQRRRAKKITKVSTAVKNLTPRQIEKMAQKIDAKNEELMDAHTKLYKRYKNSLALKAEKGKRPVSG